MSALAAKDRRALLIGALLVVPLLGWRVLVTPMAAAYAENTAKAELTASLLAREQALLRDGPRLPALLDAARGRLRTHSGSLFPAADTVAAVQALASWLRASARAVGLTDVNVQGVPALQPAAALLEPQADVRARGSIAALASWLERLETGERLVQVERLDVSADADGQLAIGARVRGFALKAAP